MYISLLHTEYLRKICDEKESSLQGLKYIGGPMCPECEWREVIPYVSYPDEQETPSDEAECEECGLTYNVNLLLTSQVNNYLSLGNDMFFTLTLSCSLGETNNLPTNAKQSLHNQHVCFQHCNNMTLCYTNLVLYLYVYVLPNIQLSCQREVGRTWSESSTYMPIMLSSVSLDPASA